jgi:N-ethylmaleimide reductase
MCLAIGSDRVGVRISPLGVFNDASDTEPELIYRHVAQRLSPFNLAYLHVIRPEVSGWLTCEKRDIADPLPEIRSLYKGTIIVAGDLDVVAADKLVDSGCADGVGFGRWFISNPDLTQRLKHGWPLETPERATFYTEGARGYNDYLPYRPEL